MGLLPVYCLLVSVSVVVQAVLHCGEGEWSCRGTKGNRTGIQCNLFYRVNKIKKGNQCSLHSVAPLQMLAS